MIWWYGYNGFSPIPNANSSPLLRSPLFPSSLPLCRQTPLCIKTKVPRSWSQRNVDETSVDNLDMNEYIMCIYMYILYKYTVIYTCLSIYIIIYIIIYIYIIRYPFITRVNHLEMGVVHWCGRLPKSEGRHQLGVYYQKRIANQSFGY